MKVIPHEYRETVWKYINKTIQLVPKINEFQSIFCMTTEERANQKLLGPYELLENIKCFIADSFSKETQANHVSVDDNTQSIPMATAIGYFILHEIITAMKEPE